jgi:hypothetical protein
MGLYPRRSATSTLSFLDRLLEEMPFPIQRLQTDRGLEFLCRSRAAPPDEVGHQVPPYQATLTVSHG